MIAQVPVTADAYFPETVYDELTKLWLFMLYGSVGKLEARGNCEKNLLTPILGKSVHISNSTLYPCDSFSFCEQHMYVVLPTMSK